MSTSTGQSQPSRRAPARNTENDKKTRILRDLKSGKKKCVQPSILDQLPWTEEQRLQLVPYMQEKTDPFEITNEKILKRCFTKKEAYDAIETKTKNATTRTNYRSRVNALLVLMEVTNQELSRIFEDPTKLLQRIENHYRDPTSYYDFLYFILKASPKLLNDHQPDKGLVPPSTLELIEKTRNESKNRQVAKQLQDRRDDVEFIRVWKKIFEVEKQLSISDYGSMKHIIALMYTRALYDANDVIHMNPRNYFLKVALVRNDSDILEKGNFYNLSNGRLVINDYKTSKIYDSYDVTLTEYCRDVITRSLQRFPRDFLVERVSISDNNTPPATEDHLYKNNSLSDMVKAIFDGYSINKIRKSIESYEINVKNSSSIHLADVSRHTVITQTTNYLAT